jgi:hypothetical protein
MTGHTQAIVAEVDRLRASVKAHKEAIRRNREQLQDAKTKLVTLEAMCRELGIGFTVQE